MVAQAGGQASLIGKTLGNYAVKALIGRGALGTVYLAKDVALGRPVALKVLLGSLAHNAEQVRRFLGEAKAAAPLLHPNIVAIYEAGIREGTPFIAMEYVEGEPLDRMLRRRNAPLTWQMALHIAGQVAEALDCAHAQGVVHRDVKPANILLDRQGRVRLSDFGIASLHQDAGAEAAPDAGRAETLHFLGTPEYMSPEQCAGRARITSASDLYSLGVALYQMLSAQMPFEARSTIALLNTIIQDKPKRLSQAVSGVPDDVARLVAHLMEKDPAKRPASAKAVCDAIRKLQQENGGASAVPEALNSFIRDETRPRRLRADTPTPVRAPRTQQSQGRAGSRKRGILGAVAKLAAGLVLAATLTGAGYWYLLRPDKVAEAAPRLNAGTFTQESGGISKVALPAGPWRVSDLHWVGKRPVVLAEVAGAPGTLAHGAWGWIAVDLENNAILSPRAPVGPMLDARYGAVWPGTPQIGLIPDAPDSSVLHEAVLLQTQSQEGGLQVVTQRWDTALPRAVPLFTIAGNAPQTPWAQATGIAGSPNGYHVCVVLRDQANRGDYLVERDIRGARQEGEGTRLTSAGAPIPARSVQYAPDASKIAYIREKNSVEQELWVVNSGGSESDGHPVLQVQRCDAAAFRPDGQVLAVTVLANDTNRIRLLRASDANIEADLGEGRTGGECWHPSSRYLVAVAADPESGKDQLWAIESAAPYRRSRLTRLPEGVTGGGAISRDGRWAAAVTETGGTPCIVLMDLSTLMFMA